MLQNRKLDTTFILFHTSINLYSQLRRKIGICSILICFSFICCYPTICNAQFEEGITQLQARENDNAKLIQRVSFLAMNQEPHDLYIHPEWTMGWLSLKRESAAIPVMTRFNILSSTVELMSRNKLRILQTNSIDMIMIGTHLFIPDESSPSGYFEILSQGKINLLAAHQIRDSYESSTMYPSSLNVDKKITAKIVYYFSKNGEKAKSLKTKKKKIIALMEDSKEIKQFIEAENLKLSKKEHLVRLFEFYNQL